MSEQYNYHDYYDFPPSPRNDDGEMTDEQMLKDCEKMMKGRFLVDDALNDKIHQTLGSIHDRLTGKGLCDICQNTSGNHYYSCSKALKCPTCKCRTDLPTTEQYPGCKCKPSYSQEQSIRLNPERSRDPGQSPNRGSSRNRGNKRTINNIRSPISALAVSTSVRNKPPVPNLLTDFPALTKQSQKDHK